MINLGYPWWSLAALVAPALLLFHVLRGHPHRARHGVRHHRPPDGGLYRNPDRLALFVFLIYGVVFGLPIPLKGFGRHRVEPGR